MEPEFIKFMSMVIHQLRTPVSVIKGYLSMLRDKTAVKSEIEREECLEEIGRANEKMINLINALATVFKIESGALMVNLEPTDLSKIGDEAVSQLMPQIREKKIKLEKKYDPDLPTINADSKLTCLIIQNLLSNAVKYTPEGGKVDFVIQKRKTDALIKVSDTGCGIPEEQQSKIFTKFFRADNVTQETEGAGLGLYIVKSIIERFGGEIRFESKENKGTNFYVSIPLTGAPKKKA